jgi:hypothetical protein
MMRHPSKRLTRAIRALTALAAAWCLACAASESFMTPMAGTASGGPEMTATPWQDGASMDGSPMECHGCQSPPPPDIVVALNPLVEHSIPAAALVADLPSVARKPLVPPPERQSSAA